MNLNQKTHFLILFLSLMPLHSCRDSINKEFYDNFTKYLKDVHAIETERNASIFYILHLQGCNTCLDSSYKYLNKMELHKRDQFSLILVGSTDFLDTAHKNQIEDLRKRFRFLIDDKQLIFSYNTGFAYPLLIRTLYGKCDVYEELFGKKYQKVFSKKL